MASGWSRGNHSIEAGKPPRVKMEGKSGRFQILEGTSSSYRGSLPWLIIQKGLGVVVGVASL